MVMLLTQTSIVFTVLCFDWRL